MISRENLDVVNITKKTITDFKEDANEAKETNTTFQTIIVAGKKYYNKNEELENRYILEINILPKPSKQNNLTVIMFNPSEAGKNKDGIFIDQTVTNVIKIANDTGHNSIKILNLIPIINSKQKNIKKNEPIDIGFIKKEIEHSTDILIAWGKAGNAHINRNNYDKKLMEILSTKNIYTFCANKNKQYPKHPARLDIECCRNCYGRSGNFILEKYVLK